MGKKPAVGTALFRRAAEAPGGMAESTAVQCPVCGWTGDQAELAVSSSGASCPTCDENIRLGS